MSFDHLRIFLDRSIGTFTIAAALRELGLDIETMHDRYGQEAPFVIDTRWIADATAAGRILLSADQRIRYRPLERRAICDHQARCFTFASGDLTGAQMIERLVQQLPAIAELALSPGPYVCHLRPDRVERMTLDCAEPVAKGVRR